MKREPKTTSALSVENRLHEPWIFRRVIFKIGILDDHYVSRRRRYAGTQRRALAAVDVMIEHAIYQRRNFSCEKFAVPSVEQSSMMTTSLSG